MRDAGSRDFLQDRGTRSTRIAEFRTASAFLPLSRPLAFLLIGGAKMATFGRWLPLAALLLTACGEEPVEPDDLGPPLPGVVSQSASPVPGAEVPTSGQPGEQSCITRYDFTGSLADAECLTEWVDGDPLHWITTCPAHDRLTEQEEVVVDEAGRRLFDATRDRGSAWTRTLTYDDLDRLIEIRFDSENDETGDSVIAFTEFNERGQPLHMTRTGDDWNLGDHSIPANNEYGTYEYDALERLIHHETRFSANDSLHVDIDIEYDDAARRRNWNVTVDISGIDPNAGGPGENGGSELFDEENQLVELDWFTPPGTVGMRDSFLRLYRYDDEGRLLTTVFEEHAYGRDLQYTAHEIYDCP